MAQLASVWPKLGWLWLGSTLAFAVYHSGGSLWRGRWPSQIICPQALESAFICAAFQQKLFAAGIACAGALVLHEGARIVLVGGSQLRRAPARRTQCRMADRDAWACVRGIGGLFLPR